jgi:predicted RNA binding protein YcfA (HicA-like mRNA interferase family)
MQLPVLKPDRVIRALCRAGFFIHHQRGSHCYLKHPDRPPPLVSVPRHNRDLKRKTLESIIEQAGLTEEQFLALL